MATRTDREIIQYVQDELRYDCGIDSTDIGVSAKNGVVTLSGVVHRYIDKVEAERDTKRIFGVVGVANDIQVQLRASESRSDPDIARDAVAQLQLELPYLAKDLKVIVETGWVRLEGKVEWQYERDRAEAAVRRPLGVVGVSNLLELKPRASASQIKEKVEQAFKRSAQIDAERIQVKINGSEAVLKGSVRSFAEREEAERAAWLAPGVTKVDDRLVVSY